MHNKNIILHVIKMFYSEFCTIFVSDSVVYQMFINNIYLLIRNTHLFFLILHKNGVYQPTGGAGVEPPPPVKICTMKNLLQSQHKNVTYFSISTNSVYTCLKLSFCVTEHGLQNFDNVYLRIYLFICFLLFENIVNTLGSTL